MTPKPTWVAANDLLPQSRWSFDIFGGGGSGKTHFIVYTCPGPIYLLNFDRNPAQIIKASERKDIYVCDLYTEGLWMSDDEAREVWARTEEALGVVKDMTEGTLAIDGGSAMTSLLTQIVLADVNEARMAKGLEEMDKLIPVKREALNSRVRNLLASASHRPVNFVITHQQKEVWVRDPQSGQDKPSGRFEARENTQIEYQIDMSLYMFTQWKPAKPPATEKVLGHYGKVAVCKHNQSIINERYEDPSFDLLVGMMGG